MGPKSFHRCLAPLAVLLLLCCRNAAAEDPSWCVARPDASDEALKKGINYACGDGGADCVPIQPSGSCYNPNTLHDHASYAYNAYYQIGRSGSAPLPAGWHGPTCDFDGSAMITNNDPSTATCKYPSCCL